MRMIMMLIWLLLKPFRNKVQKDYLEIFIIEKEFFKHIIKRLKYFLKYAL